MWRVGAETGTTIPGSVEWVDLERFLTAQDSHHTYAHALAELRSGQKTSHWMWFVFPQIAGLGRSSMAQAYAIADLAEAQAYLAHPVLGARLIEMSEAMLGNAGRSADAVLGGIDAVKLRSSMTLFAIAGPDQPVFGRVLEEFFDGPDPMTEQRLAV